MSELILYDYFRSSASYRVRIGLNLKGARYEQRKVNLVEGAQNDADYRALNPQGLVPLLIAGEQKMGQSLAILDWLDAHYEEPPFVPADPDARAHVLAMALAVACDIHPLNNLRVLKYLKGELGVDEDAKDAWYRHWVREGFAALEEMARPHAGAYLFGDEPTLADICLVPQLYNARRFSVPVSDFPTLRRADETASGHPAFAAAHPDLQEPRA
ncbi:maleylacetoacetate isomerase [Sphingomicrobium lutaoense]|uniref:Maleylacetoacetate isomerase n=1 Tax=Sphingomicrobium lutaoense TaxID=515949 RepID=A0A839Z409_9SPHN|nr:maleylacetoacetate isomerase [Sphingomicrobium lutaoense]MBB3764563.1 maleylacetoacetate isomerase [Sphingomicrobium lutaoense]